MDWCVAIHRVQACSEGLRRRHGEAEDALDTLLRLLSHEDVIVAFAAKETLQEVLTSQETVKTTCVNVIQALLLPCGGTWRREACGFRFQLLRQLIKMKSGGDDGEDESSEEEVDRSDCVGGERYMHAVLGALNQVGDVVRSVFVSADGTRHGDDVFKVAVAPCSVQYEGLVFLSDFIKELRSIDGAESYQRGLIELMTELTNGVSLTMDYVSQPTFVSCAMLDLLGNFLKLMELWRCKLRNDCMDAAYATWLEHCLVWLMHSSCTSTALQLLGGKKDLDSASQNAFVAASSRYPFLQKWFLYLTRLGVALLDAVSTRAQCATGEQLRALGEFRSWTKQLQLPSRRQLFVVLAEQDDVMIEVLNGLTRIAGLAHGDDRLAQWPSQFAASMLDEFDPDNLFADLVDTLGQDHLVLLDFLVSNETQMLEYLMRYLRHLGNHWSVSKKKLQSSERLEGVMSVLIRLRLEIDRLVAVDMFPYAAGPLTRRLLTIEQLFEAPEK